MATGTGGAAEEGRAAPAWVLMLAKAGVYQGMVGPFSSQDEAEAWATGLLEPAPGWTWRTEPMVSPASLSQAASSPPPAHRRPQLTVVR